MIERQDQPRVRFQRVREGVNRIEVLFNDQQYLHELGRIAVDKRLVTGYTIFQGDTSYRWDGDIVEGDIFVLKATIPEVDTLEARLLYQLFYEGIRKKWDVPVVYFDKNMAANPDFVKWMRDMSETRAPVKIVRKANTGNKWVYRQPSYIHLVDRDYNPGEKPIKSPKHSHIATLVTERSHSVIVPGQTKVFAPSYRDKEDVRAEIYQAIHEDPGLEDFDRETLKRGREGLRIILPDGL